MIFLNRSSDCDHFKLDGKFTSVNDISQRPKFNTESTDIGEKRRTSSNNEDLREVVKRSKSGVEIIEIDEMETIR